MTPARLLLLVLDADGIATPHFLADEIDLHDQVKALLHPSSGQLPPDDGQQADADATCAELLRTQTLHEDGEPIAHLFWLAPGLSLPQLTRDGSNS